MRISSCHRKSLARALPPGESMRSDDRLHVVVLLEPRERPDETSLDDPARLAEEPATALHRDGAVGTDQRDRRGTEGLAGDRAEHVGQVVAPAARRPSTEADHRPHRACLLLERLARLVEVAHLVDQAALLRGARRVRTVLRGVRGHGRTRRANAVEPGRAHVRERGFERSPRFRARAVAREGLLRPLVFSDLQEVDAEPELVREQLVKVDALRREPHGVDARRGSEPDALARARREVERAVREIVGVTPHGKARAERAEERADLLGPREPDSRRAEPDEHPADLLVATELLDLVDELFEGRALRRQAEQPGRGLFGHAVR